MKRGFTLAEVLVTLGIIGVVAALTAPALVQNAGNAKIGPSLAKAVSTFESANERLLYDLGAKSLIGSGLMPSNTGSPCKDYIDKLGEYLKLKFVYISQDLSGEGSISYSVGTYDGTAMLGPISVTITTATKFLTKEGFMYMIYYQPAGDATQVPHKREIALVYIDINAFGKPNKLGRDVFTFRLKNDGSLVPVGSTDWNGNEDSQPGGDAHWTTKCNANAVSGQTPGEYCAGSIFENDLKVIYE